MGKIEVQTFDIEGPALITPKRFGDERGYFSETWSRGDWAEAGLPPIDWVQDNEAFSAAVGTTRGLHFQAPPSAQTKLLRAVQGEIFDVAVDIRKGSPTYGKSVSAKLTSEGGEQLFVPRGFAHGYQTLTPDTLVAYKCDGLYDPSTEGGLLWSDSDLDFEWPVTDDAKLSARDEKWPVLADLDSPFTEGA
ncbi:MAG: dTDP-4-dehydrorhamnose 3,5-epimerase [Pseudomonadota bacterium]